MADNGKSCLFVLQGTRIGPEGIHAAQESKAALGHRRLLKDVFESAPCDECNEDGCTGEHQARDKEVKCEHLVSDGMECLTIKHEKGERGDIEPEPLCADGGKAQKDLAEEGQNDRKGQKIEEEVEQKE